MLRRRIKALLSLLVYVSLILCGCSAVTETEPEPDTVADDYEVPEPIEVPDDLSENVGYSKADSVFTMNYDPSYTLNPIYGTNTYNVQIFSLVYEGLFRLGDNLEPEKVLCAEYNTPDGINYTFTLVSGVRFHDGEPLTAKDVEYTINLAAGSSKYSSRFSSVIAVNAVDELTLTVTLSRADYGFPSLLDIPVIEYGSGDMYSPPGTGPYFIVDSEEGSYLSSYSSYRDAEDIPLDTIYLARFETEELSEAFSGRVIDILDYDPTGSVKYNIHLDYETRLYNTTDFVYIGFNTSKGITSSSYFRQAVSYLVDVYSIRTEIYENSVTASPLLLSPVLSFYDESWEECTGYSRQSFTEYLLETGFTDSDGDGFWESPSYGKFSLTIIVNSESDTKVAIAERLASELNFLGISAEVVSLPWDRFLENLNSGSFNIYIGEAMIPADFDFTELLSPGGSLNYSGITGSKYVELISDFLSSSGEDRTEAARMLCEYTAQDASIIPVAYKQHAVISHTGVISGLSPSQSGILCGIAKCTINP